MGDLSFFGVLRLRLAPSAAPNSAQDDRLFNPLPSEEFALEAVDARVLSMLAQGFDNQTDESVGHGVCD
jgi:hypothetical protein